MADLLDPTLFNSRSALYVHALNRFVAREGHASPAKAQIEDGLPIGKWVASRRSEHTSGRLSRVRAEALEALPGWMWGAKARMLSSFWETGIAALDAFGVREGHVVVPRSHTEGGCQLGTWVMNRRVDYRKGLLAEEHIAALEAYPGWSWGKTKDQLWAAGVEALSSFVERERHACVPMHHTESGHPLGAWVCNLRQKRANGMLAASRVDLLEQFPGWEWDIPAARWDAWIDALGAYVQRVGDARVPQDHIEDGMLLGEWVLNCRRTYRTGTLPGERIAQLEAFKGWAWVLKVDGRWVLAA